MIKSNKPRNSREGGERAGRLPYEAEQSPKGPSTSSTRCRCRRHRPARPRYSVPGPGSRSRPAPARRPGLSGAPHGEAPPFLSSFLSLFSFSPFLSFSLSFLFFFFPLARGRRVGCCVLPRPRRAEPSRLGPGPPPAPQRDGAGCQRRRGTAPLRTASSLCPRRCGALRGTQPPCSAPATRALGTGQRSVRPRNSFPNSVRYKGLAVLAQS